MHLLFQVVNNLLQKRREKKKGKLVTVRLETAQAPQPPVGEETVRLAALVVTSS